jgi:hypothetical protein
MGVALLKPRFLSSDPYRIWKAFALSNDWRRSCRSSSELDLEELQAIDPPRGYGRD